MATKKNGNRKRLSPSVERQIALALVRVVECLGAMDNVFSGGLAAIESNADDAKALADLKGSVDEAKQVLTLNGYGDLESIASRVAALENQLTAAISIRDGKEISRLGAALDRAKAGKQPLVVVEKKTKPASTERKSKVTKAVKVILEVFDNETLADGEGHVVTGIKADDTGKACLVQFDNGDKWVGVDPKDLKPVPPATLTEAVKPNADATV